MNNASFVLRRMLCGLVVIIATSTAHTEPVITRLINDDPMHTVGARVLASFVAHAGPARDWYVDALDGRRPDTRQFTGFSRQFATATFVSFTYEYRINGELRRRVYHARSGQNDLAPGLDVPRMRRRYATYFSHGPDIVAWAQNAPRGSHVTESPVQGDTFENARKRDAELKIARQIERDIRDGLIVSGGRLNGYASQIPCTSCEAALQALSDAHGIRVHVAYLGHGSPAYTRFDRMRHQYLTSIEVAVNGGQLNLLNRSADTPSERVGAACLDAPGDGEINEM